MIECDYLIIGGGAAGAVAAARLSENPGDKVVLAEAGKDVPPENVPADILDIFPLSTFNPDYVWPDLKVHWRGRENSPAVSFQQGRILGGGSAVMGMWAVRGMPDDYDAWSQLGATGWAWEDVLPYFRKIEADQDFAGDLHGGGGPLPIRRQPRDEWSPLARAMEKIAHRHGFRVIEDMNADFGDGYCVLPISRHPDRRASAGLEYLNASTRSRKNLNVLTEATVERIEIDPSRRVVGAKMRLRDGTPMDVRAGHTILTAGAIYSPALLQRSGVGDAERLQAIGLKPVLHRPGVGRNLQNHPLLPAVACLTREGRDARRGRPPASTYLRWSSNLPGMPPGDMGMYVRSYLVWHALGRHMAMVGPVLMRPASRGEVSLDRKDPQGSPSVAFNFFEDERDLQRMKDGFRKAALFLASRDLRPVCGDAFVLTNAAQLNRFNTLSAANAAKAWLVSKLLDIAPPFGKLVVSRFAEMVPVEALVRDDAVLTEFVLENTTGTNHVAGTCRMGRAGDPDAVVDPAGRLLGLDSLTVADASVMPTVPSGNTHLPTVMVAEKIVAGLRQGR